MNNFFVFYLPEASGCLVVQSRVEERASSCIQGQQTIRKYHTMKSIIIGTRSEDIKRGSVITESDIKRGPVIPSGCIPGGGLVIGD